MEGRNKQDESRLVDRFIWLSRYSRRYYYEDADGTRSPLDGFELIATQVAFKALTEFDDEAFKYAVERGALLDAQCSFGGATVFHIIGSHSNSELLKWLIRTFPDVGRMRADHQGRYPSELACVFGHNPVMMTYFSARERRDARRLEETAPPTLIPQ